MHLLAPIVLGLLLGACAHHPNSIVSLVRTRVHPPPSKAHQAAWEQDLSRNNSVSDTCWVSSKTVRVSVPSSYRLGNALSLYLEGLAKATLGNVEFESTGTEAFATFLKELPTKFPVPRPHGPSWEDAVEHACQRCHHIQEFPHHCIGSWADPHVLDTLRDVIHTALRVHGLDKVKEQFEDDEAVVHLRCHRDTLLLYKRYGLPAFSIFDAIPKHTPRVTFVEGPSNVDVCVALREAAKARVHARVPKAKIQVLVGGHTPDSISEDFARLVFAPLLVRGVGSFSLWAAYANRNKVMNPSFPEWGWEHVDIPNWQFSKTPVLSPKVALDAFREKVNVTPESMKTKIIPWLKKH